MTSFRIYNLLLCRKSLLFVIFIWKSITTISFTDYSDFTTTIKFYDY